MPTPAQAWKPASWHVLTEMSVPVEEFGRALSGIAQVVAWVPEMSLVGLLQRGSRKEVAAEHASLRRVYFPLQRGYARLPSELSATAFRKTLAMLMEEEPEPARSVLVCTSSFWAPVAERWPGMVVYYATDFTAAYPGLSAAHVLAADRAMCRVAKVVCPNSRRLADYLVERAGCDLARVVVVPNATRAANVRDERCEEPGCLPEDVAELRRPIAGVIGNMGNNVDWELVCAAMEATPEYTWLFVGPTSDAWLRGRNQAARSKAMRWRKARFIGARPYAELYRYARAVDVAVMPYHQVEPTYSGSATRFYEHLAAGRPMLATRGVEELLHKEPLVKLVDTAEEIATELARLQGRSGDGLESTRCQASRTETWEARSQTMFDAVMERWTRGLGSHEEAGRGLRAEL